MMIAAAIVFVVLLWASSTAAIFYLDSLSPKTFSKSMLGATVCLMISAFAIWILRDDQSAKGLAASFAAGLVAWGWTEMALYMGYVTGPRKQRCTADCNGTAHFGHAVAANLWHEILVIAFAVAIWWSGNAIALTCFILLWLMHLSARLNVFLGVRNVSEEFVPEHMNVLKGFLRRRNMNWLFPISCLSLIFLLVHFVQQPTTLTSVFYATLTVVGLVEHVLLMLPLPIEKMWHWTLSKKTRSQKQNYTLGVPS